MKRLYLSILFHFIVFTAYAQSSAYYALGIGGASLGTGGKTIAKLDGEISKKWNNVLSSAIILGIGYGDFVGRAVPIPTHDQGEVMYGHKNINPSFISQLDANIFASPLGNDHVYNLKFGTGASLLYAHDQISEGVEDKRVSVGVSAIVENEFNISQNYILGLKCMLQPYLNGDINISVMIKIGEKLK